MLLQLDHIADAWFHKLMVPGANENMTPLMHVKIMEIVVFSFPYEEGINPINSAYTSKEQTICVKASPTISWRDLRKLFLVP